MEVYRRSSWLLLLLGVSLLAATLHGVQGEAESEGPSESECRPYIEKALKELETGEAVNIGTDSKEDVPTVEITTDDSEHGDDDTPDDDDGDNNAQDAVESAEAQSVEDTQEVTSAEGIETDKNEDSKPDTDGESQQDAAAASVEEEKAEEKSEEDTKETTDEEQSAETKAESVEQKDESTEEKDETKESVEEESAKQEEVQADEAQESVEGTEAEDKESVEDTKEDTKESAEDTKEDTKESAEDTKEDTKESAEDTKEDTKESVEDTKEDTKESVEDTKEDTKESTEDTKEDTKESTEDTKESVEDKESKEGEKEDEKTESVENATDENQDDTKEGESAEEAQIKNEEESKEADESDTEEAESKEDGGAPVEEELSLDTEIPTNLKPRDHVEHLLKLDEESSDVEKIIDRISEITLRELKKLYENAIKPLETLYKYRDLSNRHFGDAEIYSKPLILFMGPWSGGKSTIINYLVDNEYNETSLRTGAEPSPAYFNILMYGEEPEILDGSQLVSDFTFSGLQKFGQGLEERLRGYKLPSKLLEKVNIVEIPGILEVRKQVSRVFPFNDACQWFIDRADIIFLVYDPSKLDVGPETEAILDQLKGREHQTRIILNKADQVKPEELMRVQGALIWNISPLMSSPQPPVMYTTSLWSQQYESWAPVRLLQAQERAFLRDLRTAIDKRIDNKIASARRFAVRVRNHAKMVDCYLTTYYNHKSVFGNRKQVADQIIEHPQDYHIYEGLSTLTNISRYDLPDPEVYKDFFKLNPLYEFQQLSATCTYFRGCPINRLDVAIAYDLPELIGKHRRLIEAALAEANPGTS